MLKYPLPPLIWSPVEWIRFDDFRVRCLHGVHHVFSAQPPAGFFELLPFHYCRIFLTLKFIGSDLCYFYIGPVIESFRQIYWNKLGFLKFNVS